MKIETKYNFGDVLYTIHRGSKTEWMPCDFCGETGRISGVNGDTKPCPECYGRRGENKHVRLEWKVEGDTLTVGLVEVRITNKYTDGEDSDASNFGHQEHKREEWYMCYETGIGSGTNHPVESLFPTIEEAQAECDKRNEVKDDVTK